MKKLIILIFAVLLSSFASASIIDDELTVQKCGNGIKEGYELCEPNTLYDLCPSIGKILGIAMVCNERTCDCLPNIKSCGNGIPEGSEACESDVKGYDFDICPNVSQAIGLPLKCDLDTCDCVAEGLQYKVSYCGDSLIEGYEDCEVDDDCPRGRVCTECECVREVQDLNLTPVEYNVTAGDVPVPTVEDIIRRQKVTILDFVLDDYVGEVIPDELDYFDGEEINIYIDIGNNKTKNVSVITTQMVVQEVHPYSLNKTSMEMWMEQSTVAQLKASDERTELILKLLENGEIKYKPKGFFRRIWFWFFTPY